MKTVQYKVGELVRVHAHRPGEARHGIPSGAVCVVVGLAGWHGSDPGRLVVRLSSYQGGVSLEQSVRRTSIRPAKQAMRKRGQYSNLRG